MTSQMTLSKQHPIHIKEKNTKRRNTNV